MKIMLAYDGSEAAMTAARFLAVLPLPRNSKVYLVSVVEAADFSSTFLGHAAELSASGYNQEVHLEAASDLRGILNLYEDRQWSVFTRVLQGDPCSTLLKMIGEEDFNLVVVGAREKESLLPLGSGRVWQRLLHEAACSVFVARGSVQRVPRHRRLKFLVTYDGSETGEKAVTCVRDLPLGGLRKLTFMHVVEDCVERVASDHVGRYMARLRKHQVDIADELSNFQRIFTELYPQLTVHAELVPRQLNVAQAIIDFGVADGSDVICMGCSPKAQHHAILPGVISRTVAEAAPISVWVFRHPHKA